MVKTPIKSTWKATVKNCIWIICISGTVIYLFSIWMKQHEKETERSSIKRVVTTFFKPKKLFSDELPMILMLLVLMIVNVKLSIVWADWYPLVFVQHFRKRKKIKFPHLSQLIFITAIITFMLLLKSRFQFHFSFDLTDFFPRLTRLLLLRFSAYFSQPTLTLSSTTSILSRKPRATSPEVFK